MTTQTGPALHGRKCQNLKKNVPRMAQAIGQLSQNVVVLFSDATPNWMFI